MTTEYKGDYIRMLHIGCGEEELLMLAQSMEKYSEQGFRIKSTIHENKGITPAEGTLIVIMEYDQAYMNAVFEANKKDRGH